MARKKLVNSVPTPFENSRYDYYEVNELPKVRRTRKQRICRCCIIWIIIIFFLALLVFIGVFVALPVSFMYSVDMQRSLVFSSWEENGHAEYTNFLRYGIEGARNLYVDIISKEQKITLGVWQILPLAEVCQWLDNDDFSYDITLRFSSKPVLLYFHDTNVNRADKVNVYRLLRQFFQVIVFDYRGCGDSTNLPKTEEGLVEDSVQLYKWLTRKTNAEIYVWGHSLGAAIAAHAMVELRQKNIVPMGVFLEAPFTSLRDCLTDSHPIGKYFSWTPWYDKTVLEPLEKNGYRFKTVEHVLSIDCPIMILHAEDDDVVPYYFSEELQRVTQDMRDPATKGSVSLYVFEPSLKFGHNKMYEALDMPDIIRKHIGVCKEFKHRNIDP